MRCFAHQDVEPVGVCVRCGKAICAECAIEVTIGRLACSARCAASRETQAPAVSGCLFYVLAIPFFGAGLCYLVLGFAGMAALLGAIAVTLIFAGRHAQRQPRHEAQLLDAYYRTGDAMEKAHRYHKVLAELLALHGRFAQEPVTYAQLVSADKATRARTLEHVFREANLRAGVSAIPEDFATMAKNDTENISFCQRLAENYFVRFGGRGRFAHPDHSGVAGEMVSAHMPLRASILWMRQLNKTLAERLNSETREDKPR